MICREAQPLRAEHRARVRAAGAVTRSPPRSEKRVRRERLRGKGCCGASVEGRRPIVHPPGDWPVNPFLAPRQTEGTRLPHPLPVAVDHLRESAHRTTPTKYASFRTPIVVLHYWLLYAIAHIEWSVSRLFLATSRHLYGNQTYGWRHSAHFEVACTAWVTLSGLPLTPRLGQGSCYVSKVCFRPKAVIRRDESEA